VLAALVCLSSVSCGDAGDDITLQGSGATFPAPLYKRWFLEYYKQHPNVRVNYQPIGSGAGIRQFTEGLTDFGASDAAMSDAEIGKVPAERGVLLLPMTAGSIAISYNLPDGPDELKLTRQAYVDIFLGKITAWNDPAIASANPGVNLPDMPLTVVRRAESSGTTYVFTNHLSAISEEWKKERGVGKSITWQTDSLGGKGNDGVTALIQQTPGAIGYLEAGFAELVHLPTASLQNRDGAFVRPSVTSGKAALESVTEIPENLRIWLPDPKGKDAYPIVTYTWILCHKKYDNPRVSGELKNVLTFCLTDGQQFNEQLGYLPLPEKVVAKVRQAVDRIEP
jgi:phosphate transport system substrate-binding protein